MSVVRKFVAGVGCSHRASRFFVSTDWLSSHMNNT